MKPHQILNMVARHYKQAPESILSRCRWAELVTPRFMTIYLIRTHLGLTWQAIAKIMNRQDHNSMIYGYQRIQNWMDVDPKLRADKDRFLKKLCTPNHH